MKRLKTISEYDLLDAAIEGLEKQISWQTDYQARQPEAMEACQRKITVILSQIDELVCEQNRIKKRDKHIRKEFTKC